MKTKLSVSLLVAGLAGCLSCQADTTPPSSRFTTQEKASISTRPEDAAAAEQRKEAEFLKALKQGVQVTELGCMRAVFVFDESATTLETRVTEAFSNADFRVFPSAQVVTGRVDPSALHQIGNDRYSDLVVYTKGSQREKAALGNMRLFEAEVTVQVYNPMSEELLISHTARHDGKRHADPVIATRTAVEAAADAAVKEAIAKTLEKAHKILVHEAQLKGVQDHRHLLQIMEYTATLKGVYHVRQLSYDKTTKLAVIEIIAAPQTEVFWRAWMEKLPKREFLIVGDTTYRIVPNAALRRKNKDWLAE